MSPFTPRLIALLVAALLSLPLAAQTDPATLSERGRQAFAERRFDDAAAIYTELVQAAPDDGGMRLNLGIALTMAGRLEDAVRELEHAVTLQPKLTAGWLFLGSNWLELGQPARAEPALRRAVGAEPGDANARELLGEALLALERYAPAADEFGVAAAARPESPRAWYGVGRSYEALARAAFADLEQRSPDSAHAWSLRGEVLAASRDLPGAMDAYRRALAIDAGFHAARAALADLLEQAGDPEAAAAERARLDGPGAPGCSSEPGPADAALRLECEYLAGRYESVARSASSAADSPSLYWLIRAANVLARDAFVRLTTLPPSPEAHQFRARMLTDRGRHLEAAGELRKALALAPGDTRLMKQLAFSLYLAKSYDEALALLQDVARRDRSADVLFLLGDTLLLAGRSGEAVKALEEALARDPDSVSTHASLGRAYAQAGEPAAAIPHLEAALAADEDGSVHYQLARAYEVVGKTEQARRMLERYAALHRQRR